MTMFPMLPTKQFYIVSSSIKYLLKIPQTVQSNVLSYGPFHSTSEEPLRPVAEDTIPCKTIKPCTGSYSGWKRHFPVPLGIAKSPRNELKAESAAVPHILSNDMYLFVLDVVFDKEEHFVSPASDKSMGWKSSYNIYLRMFLLWTSFWRNDYFINVTDVEGSCILK